MHSNLATKLLENNIIQPDTRVTATVVTTGLGGDIVKLPIEITISELSENGGTGYNNRNPTRMYSFSFDDVFEVEGMALERFAKAYDLKVDGTSAKRKMKPGRKPKHQ